MSKKRPASKPYLQRIMGPLPEPIMGPPKEEILLMISKHCVKHGYSNDFIVAIEKAIARYHSNIIIERQYPKIGAVRAGIGAIKESIYDLGRRLILLNETAGGLVHKALKSEELKKYLNDEKCTRPLNAAELDVLSGVDPHSFVQKLRRQIEVLRKAVLLAESEADSAPDSTPIRDNSPPRALVVQLMRLYEHYTGKKAARCRVKTLISYIEFVLAAFKPNHVIKDIPRLIKHAVKHIHANPTIETVQHILVNESEISNGEKPKYEKIFKFIL